LVPIEITTRVREFLTEFLPLRNTANCENSAGSAVSAEVCARRLLLILSITRCKPADVNKFWRVIVTNMLGHYCITVSTILCWN